MNPFLKSVTKYAGIDEQIETPSAELGDFAVPCFVLAKQQKNSPIVIAKELAANFTPDAYIEKAEAKGPYVNFFVNKAKYAEYVLARVDENYGRQANKEDKVMIEYCQVNTHKAFHVGHLRGTFLGSSLVNLYKYAGYNVLAANYQGDIGAHVAKVIWYLQKFKPEYPKEHRGRWLGTIYQKSSELAQDYKEEVSEVLQKLESGDVELNSIWEETRQWSLDDFEDFYNEIGVYFDHYFFESQYEKPGKEIVKQLLDKGIAQHSEGAVIIDLDKLGKFLILKSDGTALYSTKDLSLAADKFEKYGIDKSIYVVGAEQKLYFEQIFETLRKMGFRQADNCRHIPYGLVNLKGGKISSREGELIYAQELFSDVKQLAAEAIRSRHELSDEEISERSKAIALAAIKFSFLNQDNNKEIIFDKEKSLSFEGETGPYVQYSYARISSIMRKNAKFDNIIGDVNPIEHRLVRLLAEFPGTIEYSYKNYRPSSVCRYLLDLCQLFNHYYHDTQIANSAEKDFRLYLISCVRTVIGQGLCLLGIDVLEEM